jgi:hypothetical protein
MPGLTVTEEESWKTRIAARIGRRIEAIKALHPSLFDRVRRQGHARAPESPGLAAPYAELEAIHAEKAVMARREKRAQRAMIAAPRGLPIEEVCDGFSIKYGVEVPLPLEAAEAPGKRQAARQERLLADDPVDREIARLEAEKDNLLGTVWLATSPSQSKQLWSRVAELLGDQPTSLEREAPAIEPPRED